MDDPIERLAEYLLANGINAMLPQRLDADWLAILAGQFQTYFRPENDGEVRIMCLMHVAILFIAYVEGKAEFDVSEDMIHETIEGYGFQLLHEQWYRQGKLPYGARCTIIDIVSGKSARELQAIYAEQKSREHSKSLMN